MIVFMPSMLSVHHQKRMLKIKQVKERRGGKKKFLKNFCAIAIANVTGMLHIIMARFPKAK